MNVISYACAVLCRIVIAENIDMVTLANSNLSDVRSEVVWDALGVFTDKS